MSGGLTSSEDTLNEQITPIHIFFSDMDDPRASNAVHPLINVLFISLVAMICGADDVASIYEFAHHRKSFFFKYLDMSAGLPSLATFERVLSRLDPVQLNQRLMSWVLHRTGPLNGLHLACDGKSRRSSFEQRDRSDIVHTTSVFIRQNNLFLGALSSREQGHEIADAKALFELLDIKGTTITLDALHTSMVMTEILHKKKANYVLPLKGNVPARLEETKTAFDAWRADKDGLGDHHSETTKGHGRIEERSVWVMPVGNWFGELKKWRGLKSIVEVERRTTRNGKETFERSYYITSLEGSDVKEIFETIRGHWAVENQGHWCLDMIMNEDASRSRKDRSAENLAILARTALNFLRSANFGPDQLKRRRVACALNEDYLVKVLASLDVK